MARRPGTRAAARPNDVSTTEKEERLAGVLEIQRAIAAEENARFVGRSVLVLIEGTTSDGRSHGRADDHRTVVVEGDVKVGEFVAVRVRGSSAAALTGSAERRVA